MPAGEGAGSSAGEALSCPGLGCHLLTVAFVDSVTIGGSNQRPELRSPHSAPGAALGERFVVIQVLRV